MNLFTNKRKTEIEKIIFKMMILKQLAKDKA